MVTLAPNLTEIVFALGAGGVLVGVSSHSDFPREALALPTVGGLTPDLERIVSLRPDLVLATTEGNSRTTVELLERQGIPVLTTSAPNLRGVLQSIRTIGSRLGRADRGKSLAESLERRLEAAEARSRGRAPVRAILLVWPSPPQAAGRGTFGADLLREAGGADCVDRPGWPVVSLEFLVTSACRAVVYPAEDATRTIFLKAFRAGPLSRMAAVREGRLIPVDADVLTRPGPRSLDALERLASAFEKLGP
ncbi:MAG: ABC transporter substrate-binding protein [Thermoanaerobaculia bacterium]